MSTNKERLVVVVLSSEQLTFATFQTFPSDFKDKEELHINLKKTNYVGELVKLIDAADVEYIWTEDSMDKSKADIKEKEVYEQFLEKGYIYLGTKFKEKTKPLIEGFTSHKSDKLESIQDKKSDNEIKYTYEVPNKLDEVTNQACWEGNIDPKTISDKQLNITSNIKKSFSDYVSEQKIIFLEYVREKKALFIYVALTYCFFMVLINVTSNNDKNTTSKSPTKVNFTKQQICKATIAKVMGKAPSIVKVNKVSGNITYLSYIRPSDGTSWTYKCKLEGTTAIWANDVGRWRTGQFDSKITFSINKQKLTLSERYSDGSGDDKSYRLSQLIN
jgi:hypothetical protein